MSTSGYFGDDFQNLVTNLKQIYIMDTSFNKCCGVFFKKAKFIS